MVPAALQNFSKYDGNWIAAPVNVHSTNWVWINKAALDAAGGKAPETWDELVAVLDKMKANGITAARPWRPGLAGRHDLRRRRAVDWAAGLLQGRRSSTSTRQRLAATRWSKPSTA